MRHRASLDHDRGIVVVTGTSSGMGEDAALYLNELGYTVVAGVRKPADGERILDVAPRPEAFHPMMLDVTDPGQVDDAVAGVAALVSSGRGVRALFSNAGIASFDGDVSCEGQPIERLEDVLHVNFIGAARFIRAFLPLVRTEQGTIVVNSAMMTRVVIPFNGGYAASKSALEAWALSLRREVARYGVRVATIRPAAVATALASHQHPELVPDDSAYPEQQRVVQRFMDGMQRHADDPHCAPRRVSEVVAKIIATDTPRFRYSVGGGARRLAALGALPEPIQSRLLRRALLR
jgi:NAD(P)-dependent dehydrogenase (short-subunit alcohol dehydrogenase family)